MYLNSHHHPAQKWSVIAALVDRVHWVADTDHLSDEFRKLKTIFLQNRYTGREIELTFVNYGKEK